MFGHLYNPRVLSATRGPQQCHNLVGWISDPLKGLPSQYIRSTPDNLLFDYFKINYFATLITSTKILPFCHISKLTTGVISHAIHSPTHTQGRRTSRVCAPGREISDLLRILPSRSHDKFVSIWLTIFLTISSSLFSGDKTYLY